MIKVPFGNVVEKLIKNGYDVSIINLTGVRFDEIYRVKYNGAIVKTDNQGNIIL